MEIVRVPASVMTPPKGRYVVYADNGDSTYRIKGQPVFRDDFAARIFARDYQSTYNEVTTVVYMTDRKRLIAARRK